MSKSRPSEEIQSLLDMLFVQDHETFKGLPVNLQRSRLNGADLRGAHLEKAALTKAHLQGADLSGAYLQGAILYEANLQGALLRGTYFQEANLGSAHLQGSLLPRAGFQGATLAETDLRGVSIQGNLSYTFAQRMRASVGERSRLGGAIFAGGLSQEDVDSIVEDWPDKKAEKLRELLEPHIDRPAIREPLENSSAITRPPCTAEEAEQWIAEYEAAMSIFEEADDN